MLTYNQSPWEAVTSDQLHKSQEEALPFSPRLSIFSLP